MILKEEVEHKVKSISVFSYAALLNSSVVFESICLSCQMQIFNATSLLYWDVPFWALVIFYFITYLTMRPSKLLLEILLYQPTLKYAGTHTCRHSKEKKLLQSKPQGMWRWSCLLIFQSCLIIGLKVHLAIFHKQTFIHAFTPWGNMISSVSCSNVILPEEQKYYFLLIYFTLLFIFRVTNIFLSHSRVRKNENC